LCLLIRLSEMISPLRSALFRLFSFTYRPARPLLFPSSALRRGCKGFFSFFFRPTLQRSSEPRRVWVGKLRPPPVLSHPFLSLSPPFFTSCGPGLTRTAPISPFFLFTSCLSPKVSGHPFVISFPSQRRATKALLVGFRFPHALKPCRRIRIVPSKFRNSPLLPSLVPFSRIFSSSWASARAVHFPRAVPRAAFSLPWYKAGFGTYPVPFLFLPLVSTPWTTLFLSP